MLFDKPEEKLGEQLKAMKAEAMKLLVQYGYLNLDVYDKFMSPIAFMESKDELIEERFGTHKITWFPPDHIDFSNDLKIRFDNRYTIKHSDITIKPYEPYVEDGRYISIIDKLLISRKLLIIKDLHDAGPFKYFKLNMMIGALSFKNCGFKMEDVMDEKVILDGCVKVWSKDSNNTIKDIIRNKELREFENMHDVLFMYRGGEQCQNYTVRVANPMHVPLSWKQIFQPTEYFKDIKEQYEFFKQQNVEVIYDFR